MNINLLNKVLSVLGDRYDWERTESLFWLRRFRGKN